MLVLAMVSGAETGRVSAAAGTAGTKIEKAYKETEDYLRKTVTSPIVAGQMGSGGDWH